MPDIFVAKHKLKKTAAIKENPVTNEHAIPFTLPKTGGTVHLFSSYCEDPDDITFENQDEDEKVLLFIRKDLITNLPWMIGGGILVILPILIIPLASFTNLPESLFPFNYVFIFTTFYYLFVATFIFISFITWYFNVDIVTNKRVIDIEFQGIVYKNIASTKLSLVQDVSYQQTGVVRTLFDYGDVLVQTAGTIDNFTFEAVPRPDDAVHIVGDLIGKRNE